MAHRMFARWKDKPMDETAQIARWVQENNWDKERRRFIGGASNLPDRVKKMFAKLIKEFLVNPAPTTESATESRSSLEQNSQHLGVAQEERLLENLARITVEKEVLYHPTSFLNEQPTEVLLQAIVQRFDARQARILQLLEELSAKFGTREETRPVFHPPMPAPIAEPVNIPRPPKRTRIAVVGLLSGQMNIIRHNVGDKADLIYVDNNPNGNVIVPTSVDYAVVNFKFTRHATSDKFIDQLGKERVFLVEGGVQTVTQKILDLAARQ